MFSRRADALADGARWYSLLGGRSITAHIARLYTFSAIVLLTIVIGSLYWVEWQSMQWDDVHYLSDKVHQLRQAMQQDRDDSALLHHKVVREGGVFASGQSYIFYSRILDDRGRVLMETPGMDRILPVDAFPPPSDVVEIPTETEHKKSPDGRIYVVASAWAESAGSNPARRIIQVALDDSEEAEVITRYQRTSLLLVLIGILFSARIGALIARSGMRPLRQIANVAEQITASRLDKRIEPESWPRELTALATAFDGMLDRLEDSHSRLSQFSADLAHELRTPINALMGQTEVALTKERQPEEYRQILHSNFEEFQRLTRMINGLLFLARAEDPKTQIERTWLNAREELEAISEFHEALAEDHGVSLTCEGQANLYADPILFRRAVSNLLSNALRHTPSGGRIVLSAEQTPNPGALIHVRDTGCGILPEDLPRVCERKYCPDQGSARCAEGHGLGLAIVKSIAELHGGKLVLESRVGQGTNVTLHFPKPAPAGA
ncbi:MAG: heavy metal sensor histidine kinase [Betaproteobacteria bacterium]|nr:heavy metal sensor histidine kinase [Betaproteobacteria bacterium]